jgi:PiT family inorganic phosphate transporter
MSWILVAIIITVALIFDFLNGFHDAANSIATVVATKVLSPFKAVLWAAFFNFIAAVPLALLFWLLVTPSKSSLHQLVDGFGKNVHVAGTIAKGIVDIERVRGLFAPGGPKSEVELFLALIVLAGLSGAILWNVLTWFLGLPTSSSHALIGGFVGSALCAVHTKFGVVGGFLKWGEIRTIAMFIVLAPVIGLVLGYINMVVVMWIFHKTVPRKIDSWFRRLQLVSAAAYSFGHGTNDAQKTMGVITFLLMGAGYLTLDSPVPAWVIFACHAAIALGTMSGGWRIVKTMGLGITKLRPVGGFCAETAGAVTILGASHFGIPVSTTHTITGAIVGVGATHRLSAVKWGVAGRIVWAWVLTMPMAGLMAAGTYYVIHLCQ